MSSKKNTWKPTPPFGAVEDVFMKSKTGKSLTDGEFRVYAIAMTLYDGQNNGSIEISRSICRERGMDVNHITLRKRLRGLIEKNVLWPTKRPAGNAGAHFIINKIPVDSSVKIIDWLPKVAKRSRWTKDGPQGSGTTPVIKDCWTTPVTALDNACHLAGQRLSSNRPLSLYR